MKYFGTQTYYLLDKSKPYQRPELRHAGPNDVNREAELETPSRVACSDLLGITVSLSQNDHPNTTPKTDNQRQANPAAQISLKTLPLSIKLDEAGRYWMRRVYPLLPPTKPTVRIWKWPRPHMSI